MWARCILLNLRSKTRNLRKKDPKKDGKIRHGALYSYLCNKIVKYQSRCPFIVDNPLHGEFCNISIQPRLFPISNGTGRIWSLTRRCLQTANLTDLAMLFPITTRTGRRVSANMLRINLLTHLLKFLYGEMLVSITSCRWRQI